MKKAGIYLIYAGTFFIIIIFAWIFIRFAVHREIDDVTPGIPCEPEYIAKSNILWIIPLYKNDSIANHKDWCNYIKSLNKTLGLHGVYHTYNEFDIPRSFDYLSEGIDAFKDCFNETPSIFKPPQLAWNRDNSGITINSNLSLKKRLNQIFHKVYHCNNGDVFSNQFIDVV